MTIDTPHPRDGAMVFRNPRAEDGPSVSALIAGCPPLDLNSAYCNLLQCTHFAGDCIVAERGGHIEGWISGYRLPDQSDHYFLWQVAVAPSARGEGLAIRMMDSLLARSAMQQVTHLLTTVTRDNEASWALFRRFARERKAAIQETLHFDRSVHFSGRHASEWLVEIGPLSAPDQHSPVRTTAEKITTGGTRS